MAKAAGFEFISAGELKDKYTGTGQESSESSSEEDEEEGEEEDDKENSDPDMVEEPKEVSSEKPGVIDPAKRGTEIKLHHLQLLEGAATLRATKLHQIVQCERCKTRTELTLPPDQLNVIRCAKCNNEQFITYRPNLIHQFTSVLGYLDLKDCVAFDLVLSECVFQVGCLGCSKEMAVQVGHIIWLQNLPVFEF